MLQLRELSRGELESVRLDSREENFDSVLESRALPSPKNGIPSGCLAGAQEIFGVALQRTLGTNLSPARSPIR